MTTMNTYSVSRDGQQYGPYTFDVLQLYYNQGQILKTDLVRTSEMRSWISAAELFVGVPLGAEPPLASAAEPAAPVETVAPRRTRRSLRPWVWGASAVIGVAALIVLVALLLGPNPANSLDQARAAYLQRDQANFDKYVDVASVLSNGVDQIVGEMMQQNNTGGLARIAIEAAVPALKSIYLPSASRNIDQLIISGTLPQDAQSSGNDAAGALIAGYVSGALHKIAGSALSYQGVESKQVSGGNATLVVRVATPLSAEPILLKVRMQKADSYWRVVAVEDLAGLLRNLEARSAPVETTNSLPVAAPAAPAATPAATPTAADTAVVATPPAAADFTASPDEPAPPAPSPPAPADDPIGQGGFITPPDHAATEDDQTAK
jgi:hypothetical protein